jgi:hypothetical protein
MAFVLSLFAAITVQKNIRDTQRARERDWVSSVNSEIKIIITLLFSWTIIFL